MDDDMEETVSEVLAFLDAFEADEEPTETMETSTSVRGGSGAKRRRVETKYTTQLQRRKRAELSELREQVEMLEARRRELRQAGRASEKQLKVLEELAGRRRSEEENRKLRARLERQAKLCKDIGRLVDKYEQQEGALSDQWKRSFLASSSQPTGLASAKCRMANTKALEELEMLISQVETMFASSSPRPQSCWLEVEAEERLAEIRSSTAANCSVISAVNMLWWNPKEILASSMTTVSETLAEDGSLVFRQSLLPVQCRSWDEFHKKTLCSTVKVILLVEHHARRLYDAASGRAVFVVFALIRLSDGDGKVLLRENFWKCITPADEPGGNKSTTHTSYRIESGNSQATELSPVQASVMRALVQLTRRNHAMNQDWLLAA